MILKIDFSKDFLKAYLSAVEEENVEKQAPVSMNDVTAVFEEHKIVYGIQKEELKKIIGATKTIADVIVAIGDPPKLGKTAEIHFTKKPLDKEDVAPVANEEGDIDYISPRVGWIVPVKKDEEIAIKIPPTQGASGKNILGKELPGLWGKDFSLDEIGGLNTRSDETNIFSNIDGFVIQKIKISVEPIFRIYDDIGPSTGSIDIPLDYKVAIHISKDIKSGFFVKAHEVVVGGCVEDSLVEAYTLRIEQGIVGLSDIPIKATRITVGYVNGSRKIYCQSINVLREISNGTEVFCAQLKANTIQGSTITASEAIWATFINGQNKLMVGIDYKSKQIVDKCSKELNNMEEPLMMLKKTWHNSEKRMLYLKELMRKNPKHPLIAKELPQIKEIKDKLDFFLKKKKEMEEALEEASKNMFPSEKPFLLVRNGFSRDTSSGSAVDPSTIINIRQEVRKILEPVTGGLLLSFVKNELISSPRFNLKELKVRLNKIDF